MNELYIIFFLNVFVWLLPPFRNYRTPYFWFFVCLALSDPVSYILTLTALFNPGRMQVVYIPLLLLALSKIRNSRLRIIISVILIAIGLPAAVFIQSLQTIYVYNMVQMFLILLIIFQDAFQYVRENHAVNIFHVVLILYFLSLMLKFLFVVTHTEIGYLHFALATAFQILIALYFTFYNIYSSKKITVAL